MYLQSWRHIPGGVRSNFRGNWDVIYSPIKLSHPSLLKTRVYLFPLISTWQLDRLNCLHTHVEGNKAPAYWAHNAYICWDISHLFKIMKSQAVNYSVIWFTDICYSHLKLTDRTLKLKNSSRETNRSPWTLQTYWILSVLWQSYNALFSAFENSSLRVVCFLSIIIFSSFI